MLPGDPLPALPLPQLELVHVDVRHLEAVVHLVLVGRRAQPALQRRHQALRLVVELHLEVVSVVTIQMWMTIWDGLANSEGDPDSKEEVLPPASLT